MIPRYTTLIISSHSTGFCRSYVNGIDPSLLALTDPQQFLQSPFHQIKKKSWIHNFILSFPWKPCIRYILFLGKCIIWYFMILCFMIYVYRIRASYIYCTLFDCFNFCFSASRFLNDPYNTLNFILSSESKSV